MVIIGTIDILKIISLILINSRLAGNSTERLVQPQFPSNAIQAKVRSKQKDIEARNELWKHINEHVAMNADGGAAGVQDLAYTEVKTVGNPMNVTRRRAKQEQKMSSSTGRIGGHNSHTPRRRRRDRVERAIAQTDWEQDNMVGPLPGTNLSFDHMKLQNLFLSHLFCTTRRSGHHVRLGYATISKLERG